jgi:hypothetical protein
MSGFWIAFLGSALGSIVASAAVGWLDSKFRPPLAFSDALSLAFTSRAKLRVASLALLLAWLSLLFFLVSLFAFPALADLMMGAFFGVAVIYGALSFSMRCMKCHRHILVEWTTKPPFSEPAFGFKGFAAVALSCLFKRRFKCMYCGQRYHL